MPSWHLEDASRRAEQNRYTFYKPGPAEISQIKAGELVKLIFHFESDHPDAPDAERMWVIVDAIDGAGGFTGRLDNTPRWIKDLHPGDLITFRDVHIINTEHDDHDNIVNRYLPRCFVTKRILVDRQRVGYLYRETPDNEKDSGWRIMAGDESQEYMDDATNTSFVSLGAVLSCDDSIITLLDSPAGVAYERPPGSNEFVRVKR
jgi:hypothetical protein